MRNTKRVLICGSDFSCGGGVVAVSKNYMNHSDWEEFEVKYLATHINGNALKKIGIFIAAYFKIIGLLIANKIDIFHLQVCDGGPFYRKSIVLFTAKFFRKKVILHHHTDYTEFFGTLSGIKERIVRKALKRADINIVLGNNLINVIKQFEPEARVTVLHNAVPVEKEFSFHKDADTILFLGWLMERKGVMDLLKAVEQIDPQLDSNIKIALCGIAEDEIYKKICDSKVYKRIIHVGWVDQVEKSKIFERTMINVLPSYREGLPMTILETMADGIPSIASNISTIPEVIIDCENGLLISPGNVDELAEKILMLCNDRQKRYELSKSAYLTVKESFETGVHIGNLKEIYRGI